MNGKHRGLSQWYTTAWMANTGDWVNGTPLYEWQTQGTEPMVRHCMNGKHRGLSQWYATAWMANTGDWVSGTPLDEWQTQGTEPVVCHWMNGKHRGLSQWYTTAWMANTKLRGINKRPSFQKCNFQIVNALHSMKAAASRPVDNHNSSNLNMYMYTSIPTGRTEMKKWKKAQHSHVFSFSAFSAVSFVHVSIWGPSLVSLWRSNRLGRLQQHAQVNYHWITNNC